MNAFAAELESTGAPGVSVAIWESGELVFSVGLGTKDPLLDSQESPVLGSTLFRIGSVTKMLTAAATLSEVDAGRLSLEQPYWIYSGTRLLAG